MRQLRSASLIILCWCVATPAAAQRYAATQDGDVVRLTDLTTRTVVSIAPSVGNIAFEMKVNGHDVLRWPQGTVASLDDVFSDLVRDGEGRATMSVTGKSQQLEVVLGPNYRSVVVWAPTPQNFICFEPMAAITNGVNMAHKGSYKELQSIPPGGTWRESFWVRPSGF